MTTLNELIEKAVQGGELAEEESSESVEAVSKKTAPAATVASDGSSEVEKLASVLEFLGRQGVAKLLKTATIAPENNQHEKQPLQKHVQVGPNSKSPPMSQPAGGKPADNDGKGVTATTVDNTKKQTGDHHPALTSNESAISYKKTEKAKEVTPSIKSALKETPFADPEPKRDLAHAAEGGDKNIHKKASEEGAEPAQEHDLAQIRAELARRVEDGRA